MTSELGNEIEKALAAIGVTSERVAKWLDCHCSERRDRLNALGAWTQRVVAGKIERAREFLERIINVE